ncbi:FeoB small GTPase domain-containing protein, partial [Planctomycetota bacterium]
MKDKITIALAGNPNSGKTTIFNNLTGSRQHVGNYPGVTVDIKEGTFKHDEVDIKVVDLPGSYSLTAYSEEEMVTRHFILDEKPDVIVDIIDASNLERNLYLAIQLLELRVRMVLAFNMSDVAEKRGIRFDLEKLSALLGVPIIRTVGSRDEGTENIIHASFDVLESEETQTGPKLFYGRELEEEITKLKTLLAAARPDIEPDLLKWHAIKLLEHDSDIEGHIQDDNIREAAHDSQQHLRTIFKDNPEIIFADRRYGFISGVCTEAVTFT